MAQAQIRVPQQADKIGKRILDQRSLRLPFDQDEHVNIGEGKQLAASEAPHCQHGDGGMAQGSERRLKRIQRHAFDGRGEPSQYGRSVPTGEELLVNLMPDGL